MQKVEIYNVDCIKKMTELPDKSVDLILCDLPYGTTQNKWDVVIPLKSMWEQYERILKDDGIICLFATQPFTSILIQSNLKLYKYNWIWKKESPTNFANSHNSPLKYYEDICVFSRGSIGNGAKMPIRYYAQGLVKCNKKKVNRVNSTFRASQGYTSKNNMLNNGEEFTQEWTNWPVNILEYSRDKQRLHATQKPVALLEYLIKTYTKPGEVVLDNCMGSGSTAIAAINTDRQFIGMELNENYFNVAQKRIKEHQDKINENKE